MRTLLSLPDELMGLLLLLFLPLETAKSARLVLDLRSCTFSATLPPPRLPFVAEDEEVLLELELEYCCEFEGSTPLCVFTPAEPEATLNFTVSSK